jgi:hypothetical protein
MKKIALISMLALIAAGVFAQAQNPQGTRGNRPQPELITVTGKLVLQNGRIAVQSGDALYYAAGINTLTGFIDGLKEGASVTLNGYARDLGKKKADETAAAKILWVTKLTIGNRSYELHEGNSSFAAKPGQRDRPLFTYPGNSRPPAFDKRDRRSERDTDPRDWRRAPRHERNQRRSGGDRRNDRPRR